MCPELLIAVVDDDSSVRSALTRLIRSCGFRAQPFSSGGEFLRSIDDHEPDCVVLDVNMPEVNGWEVQSHLSDAKANIPVIVISGEQDPRALGRAKRNGAQHYLRKPIDADLLLGAIRNAIESRRLIESRVTR
jgi:FixJ family two-component response regulator